MLPDRRKYLTLRKAQNFDDSNTILLALETKKALTFFSQGFHSEDSRLSSSLTAQMQYFLSRRKKQDKRHHF
ncbi:protein of unknown function [Vibrio tapetis subsp. tapetis]|uniref:Uncharacterized protein n=1 Tax=Vibrio tapetis subsp. tapetis TaxID=1671868 RepID=A0A2N8ZAM9_9VIBR|nr:protein of unknown function [Vibrio tapetis subsp. tapetis]